MIVVLDKYDFVNSIGIVGVLESLFYNNIKMCVAILSL